MSVKLSICAKEKSEMLYRLCLHSVCNKIDFQCIKNIHEHLAVETVALRCFKFSSVTHCWD